MAYDSKGTVNKVILIGRLGQDPELKYTPSGVATATISVATDTTYKGQDGNNVTNTEWHRVIVWRQTAENLAKYQKKGNRIYIEGRLTNRSWDDKEGVKHYITEVVADQIQYLSDRADRQEGQGASAPPQPPMPNDSHVAEPRPEEADDLPF